MDWQECISQIKPLHMQSHEKEHSGSIWKHPYMIYIVLTVVLFGVLLGIALVAYKNGWIPSRGS